MEHEGYDCMEAYYKARESKLKEEITDLRDKVGDFGLRNDYLDCKVLELEDAVKCKKMRLSDHIEMEKMYGFRKIMLGSHCNMLEREVVQLSVNTAHNQRHLIEYMKYTEFQKDRAGKISQAWVDADIRRVEEFKEM